MKKLTPFVLLLGLAIFAAAGPARAASEEAPSDTIERGAQLVLDGLRAFFSSIPQYEAPEVLPNGDIIIRRVRPKSGEEKKDGGKDEEKGLKL